MMTSDNSLTGVKEEAGRRGGGCRRLIWTDEMCTANKVCPHYLQIMWLVMCARSGHSCTACYTQDYYQIG